MHQGLRHDMGQGAWYLKGGPGFWLRRVLGHPITTAHLGSALLWGEQKQLVCWILEGKHRLYTLLYWMRCGAPSE